MAYEIKVKGLRDTIEVSQGASMVKKKWEEFMEGRGGDSVVTMGKWTGTLSSISFFKEISVLSTSSDMRHEWAWKKSSEDYTKERESFLKMDSISKSKRLDFFRMIYWGFTQKNSEDIKIGEIPLEDRAVKIQLDFFENNPKRMLCDPILFRPIIKSKNCHSSILNVIDGAVSQDVRLSLKKYDDLKDFTNF